MIRKFLSSILQTDKLTAHFNIFKDSWVRRVCQNNFIPKIDSILIKIVGTKEFHIRKSFKYTAFCNLLHGNIWFYSCNAKVLWSSSCNWSFLAHVAFAYAHSYDNYTLFCLVSKPSCLLDPTGSDYSSKRILFSPFYCFGSQFWRVFLPHLKPSLILMANHKRHYQNPLNILLEPAAFFPLRE